MVSSFTQVNNTKLSVCVVYADDDRVVDISSSLTSKEFLYHRIDIRHPVALCTARGQIFSKGSS